MKLSKRIAMTLLLLSAQATAFAAEEPVQQASGLLDKVADYTKKFVDAAIPIAKQAYEIGLMTLRIDAAGAFLMASSAVALTFVLRYKLNKFVSKYEAKADAVNKKRLEEYGKGDRYSRVPELVNWVDVQDFFDVNGYTFTKFLTWIPFTISLIVLLDIWQWVKLIAPDLWLAHIAIEKLVK